MRREVPGARPRDAAGPPPLLELEGSTVLVTGAGGFVGPHLALALRARGAVVHGLGMDTPPADLAVEAWHTSDLRAPEGLAAALRSAKPGLIVHLAGQSSAARSFELPVETFKANALGSWHLLEAARREVPRARFLAVGSGDVYGPQPAGSRVDERSPFRPRSPYALSKAAADAFARAAAATHGLDVVRTRSFAHAGPGQAPGFAIPSWARQIAAIEAGAAEPVLRVGNLEVTRDLCDVRDVARAYVALLERGRSGAAYNVCRGVGIGLSEVAGMLVARARVAVRIEADRSRMRPADVEYLVGDPGAIERDAGWRAEIPLERTLADVLEEWRATADPGRDSSR